MINVSNTELQLMLRDGKGRAGIVKELAQAELDRRAGRDVVGDQWSVLLAAFKAEGLKDPHRLGKEMYPHFKNAVASDQMYLRSFLRRWLQIPGSFDFKDFTK